MLIYWEICWGTDFQTLYTFLCRTCATLSRKAVVSWHPHHCPCHDNKNPHFHWVFLPFKDPISEQSWSTAARFFWGWFLASCCCGKSKISPHQDVLPKPLLLLPLPITQGLINLELIATTSLEQKIATCTLKLIFQVFLGYPSSVELPSDASTVVGQKGESPVCANPDFPHSPRAVITENLN